MKCSALIKVPGVQTPVPCGQCLLCRINRRRVWTTRLLLEASSYANRVCFLTLTYSERCLPRLSSSVSTLCPEHVCLGIKRLRRSLPRLRVRYYVVGEYGDRTGRPHYHALLFGCGVGSLVGSCVSPSRPRDFMFGWWPYGTVNVGHSVGRECIEYVAQYCTKKLTSFYDSRLYPGQHPEFARMSRMGGGGIGANAIPALVSIAKSYGFVPRSVRLGGSEWPLGRYLADRVSALSGVRLQTAAQEVMYRGQMRNLSFRADIARTSPEELLSQVGREKEKKILAKPTNFTRVL